MAFFGEVRGFIVGFSTGFGTGLVARELIPTFGKMVKPATKTLIRGGYTLMERFREGMARFGETLEDLAAEVNLELKEEDSALMSAKHQKRKGKMKKGKSASSVKTHPTDKTVTPLHERRAANAS